MFVPTLPVVLVSCFVILFTYIALTYVLFALLEYTRCIHPFTITIGRSTRRKSAAREFSSLLGEPLDSQTHTHKLPRLGRDPALVQSEYDVVIIGSGYGGGVAASRIARAGKRVCLLERGKEKWPGEYPHTFKSAMLDYHVSGYVAGKYVEKGNRTGLYHTVKGDGQDVFVGNGLGGTSLINANAFLRADHRTLELNDWPGEIRSRPENLDQYYVRAESMFQPTPYPTTHTTPKKLCVFASQAQSLGLHSHFYRPPLTTFFGTGINAAGVKMRASNGSGNECTGINDHSKNSVLVTYLADAWNWGAEIFCETEAKYIKEDKARGYLVFYKSLGDDKKATKRDGERLMWIRAKELVFLGAGALGTTEILLRSKNYGMNISPLVGQKLSGNGDTLAFAYNSGEILNGVGYEGPSENPCGPTITGCIDMRSPKPTANIRDGYVVQEGAIPEALAPVIQGLLEAQPGKVYPRDPSMLRRGISWIKSVIFGPYSKGGAVNRTQTYLVMSHDNNEGILSLNDDKPSLRFQGLEREAQTKRLDKILKNATNAIAGTLVKAPRLTVHPLGGASMSSDGTGQHGAVNHIGQVFTGLGREVYEGVVCVDASIIPTSLGCNPCATITALAERTCDILIQNKGWHVDDTPNSRLHLSGKPARSFPARRETEEIKTALDKLKTSNSVQFDEVLEGYIHIGSGIENFDIAEKVARSAASSARLCIKVVANNGQNLMKGTEPTSIVTGTFSCGALSQDPLLITRGHVCFFTIDEEVSDATNLLYQLQLLDTQGNLYHFKGQKKIDSNMAFSPSKTWKATTTLYTTITREDGAAIGRGIIHLSLRNFLRELRSLGPNPSGSYTGRSLAPLRFLQYFLKNTVPYFLSPFRPLKSLPCKKYGFFPKPDPETITLTASDGINFTIKIWEPDPSVPKHSMPIVLIPGASVDDQIFSLPTIPTNTIDYFTSLGYRCYIPILRFGIGPVARQGWTAYDTRLDVKAAMEYVRDKEGGEKFYVICHCLGSITTAIALLNGDVQADWIRGMTSSQVFMNLRFSKDNALKAGTQVLLNLYRAVAGDWFSCRPSPTSNWTQFLLDQLLRFYPVGNTGELCNSSVCHRCNLPFGRCFTHSNLNYATHLHLGTFFDGIHMNFLSHLMRMGSVPPYHVRTNELEFVDLVTEENLQRMKGLKIMWLSGGANVVFDPLSTANSYGVLKEKFPDGRYERVVVPGYGHLDCWMGQASVKDVYPRVRSHAEMCEGAERSDDGGQDVDEDGYVSVKV